MTPMLLLLDNHDSFTFNLAQYLGELGADVRVVLADAITIDAVIAMQPTHVVISPGPGAPEDAGISVALVRALAGRVPILGVCLGHQAIALAFGGKVARAQRPVHGKVSSLRHDRRGLFEGIDDELRATRYHSLVVTSLPDELQACAWSADDELMALRHRTHDIHGVQFHPESIGTPDGKKLLARFLLLGAARVGLPE